jgi:sterol desaturase/sphingolipid hydroxylase (fatty acid hydroxylase superfamily)
MIAALAPAKAAIAIAWFAMLALAERVAPAAPRPPHSDVARLARNLGLWAVNTLMNPFVTAPIGAAAAALPLWTRPDLGWAGLVFDFVLLDLWTYAWHRANHECPLLWRFHRVHHLDQFLDTTSAVRFHPGEVLISALARAPLIIAADVPVLSLVLFDALMLLAALFHHSNVRLPRGLEAALRQLVVTPSHHWVHHHVERADTNSNYGGVLTLWDRLFASWSPHARTGDMRIGAGEDQDAPLWALAAAPFLGRAARSAAPPA